MIRFALPPHPNPLPRGEREEDKYAVRSVSSRLLFPLPLRERVRVRGEVFRDPLQYCTRVHQHFIIPKPQDAIPPILQPLVTNSVSSTFGVLAAIHFYNQLRLQTHKIHDVSTQWMLPPEFGSAELIRAQLPP